MMGELLFAMIIFVLETAIGCSFGYDKSVPCGTLLVSVVRPVSARSIG